MTASYQGRTFLGVDLSSARVPIFPISNESIEAVVVGLNPGSNDSVLTVAGSGDQAFALLEKAGNVVIADISEAQLELVRKRKDALEAGDYETFFMPTGSDYELFNAYPRIRYFDRMSRLDRIQERLSKLEICGSVSLEDLAESRSFDMIYASNAISEFYCANPLEVHFAMLLRGLKIGGLLYVSNGAEIHNLVKDIHRLGLELESSMTKKAQALEDLWTPNVYRKTS